MERVIIASILYCASAGIFAAESVISSGLAEVQGMLVENCEFISDKEGNIVVSQRGGRVLGSVRMAPDNTWVVTLDGQEPQPNGYLEMNDALSEVCNSRQDIELE